MINQQSANSPFRDAKGFRDIFSALYGKVAMKHFFDTFEWAQEFGSERSLNFLPIGMGSRSGKRPSSWGGNAVAHESRQIETAAGPPLRSQHNPARVPLVESE